MCKNLRYKVEQFNSLAKEFMNERWRRYKGLQNKRGFIYSAVLAMNMITLWNVLQGTVEEARKVAAYWY
jgi:CHAD domain-containing protein